MTPAQAEETIRNLYLKGQGTGKDRRVDVIRFLEKLMAENKNN